MFRHTKTCAAALLALGGSSFLLPALAQQQLQRVEITGSNLKRTVDSEEALPVTIINVEQLRQSGVTSVEQVVQMLSTSQSSNVGSNSIGSSTGGATYANLRGIGTNKTLVLLNGRRVAAFAFNVNAVDLNAIPFAAVERVEVLRDGASAIYGTDAIGGVINFITKREYKGVTLSAEMTKPQKTGGDTDRANILFGFGNLEENGSNVWISFDRSHQKRVRALDRDFARTGVIPSKGVSGTSPTTFPGNFTQGSVAANPSAPDCAPPLSLPSPTSAGTCVFDFSATIDIIPEVKTETLAGRATFKVFKDSLLSVEVVSTDNDNISRVAPDPVAGISIPAGSPSYPVGTFPGLDTTKPVTAAWRMVPAGSRTNQALSHADRLVFDLTGTLAGMDYRAGLYYTDNTAQDGAIDGYVNAPFVRSEVAAGRLNPFVPATPAQLAIIETAKRRGTFATAEGTTQGADFRLSRDLFEMSGGTAAISGGAEFRKEFYRNDTDDAVVRAIPSAGRSPNHVSGDRKVLAFTTEAVLPVTKMLEVQLAARYDDYSDAGSTFNPKIGFRLQPTKNLVLRGSANTGFKAPTLDDLYAPQTITFATSSSNDPILCPGGVVNVAAGGVKSRDCGAQVQVQQGGNTKLKPEKSKTFTLGLAFEPVKNLTMSADYWNIKLKDQINALPQASIIANYIQYADRFHRCKDLPLDVQANLNRCLAGDTNSNAIGYITATQDNLGRVETDGIDFTAAYSFPLAGGNLALTWDGTWIRSYKYQNSPTDPMRENVGVYIDSSPVFRWQHTVSGTYAIGNWSSRLALRHKTGYYDKNDPASVVGGPSFYQSVKPYTLVDFAVSTKPIKGMSLTVGVKNLFDTDPPFSNQTDRSQRGFDPRYTDPLGRTFFVRGSYSFM
ncbi:TonB-dependent receptor [Piscinibacter terrae]|nr:TonB-dependent receptor [Albitalea terrae]